MKNIIFFFGYSENIGLTFHLVNYIVAVKRNNKEIILIHDGKEQVKGLFKKVNEADIPLFDISENNVLKILEKYKNYKIIIHCQGFKQVAKVEKFKARFNIKIILTLHSYRNSQWYKYFFIEFVKIKYQNVIDIWVFSSYYSYLNFNIVSNFISNFTIIPLGIDENDTSIKIESYLDVLLNRNYSYEKNKKYIFYAAQFTKNKNHRWLLNNIKSFLTKDGNTFLILCGDGHLIKEIEGLAIKHNIRQYVKFLGRIDRNIFLSHLINANLSVVTSKSETFGHTILEPLSLNIPVLSTLVGIAPEVIKDFENGGLFSLRNERKFLLLVEFFLIKERKFRGSILKDYSWNRIAEKYIKTYLN